MGDVEMSKVPEWCKQVETLPAWLGGCRGSAEFDGRSMAVEALGVAATGKNSGLIAFGYLWRRFGPPRYGSDDHKELVGYILGTPNEEVFLDVSPKAIDLTYSVGFLATREFRESLSAKEREWWKAVDEWAERHGHGSGEALYFNSTLESAREEALKELGPIPHGTSAKWREDDGPLHDLNQAIYDALRELLRPVYVRDVAINILGLMTDAEAREWEPAEASKYAGLGIATEPLDALLTEGGSGG